MRSLVESAHDREFVGNGTRLVPNVDQMLSPTFNV